MVTGRRLGMICGMLMVFVVGLVVQKTSRTCGGWLTALNKILGWKMYYCFGPNHRIASTDHPMNRSLQYSRGYLRNTCVGFKPSNRMSVWGITLENSRRKEPGAITSLKREVIWIQPSFLDSKLGGGFKDFYFHPSFGKIPILTSIFQLCWNHQPENVRNFRDVAYLIMYLKGVFLKMMSRIPNPLTVFMMQGH